MSRLAPRFALVAVAATVAACAADNSTNGSAIELTPSAPAYSVGNDVAARHVQHIRGTQLEQAPKNNARIRGTGISYHGGPVLQAGTKVAAVYWASSAIYPGGPTPGTAGSGSQDGSLVGFFLSHLGGSPYFNINSTYTDGSGNKIVNSVAYTQYYANNTNVPSTTASVSDAQMASMLQSAFASGALTYDPSTLYAIFTAGKTNLGGGFGTQYCAYHTHATVTVNGVSKTVLYAAMPYDYAYPSACSNGTASPNSDPGADAEVNTLAHETEETTTDMMGNAWYDSRGYENADKCAWTWGATYTTGNGGLANMNLGGKDFLVQQNWQNAGSGGCVLKF